MLKDIIRKLVFFRFSALPYLAFGLHPCIAKQLLHLQACISNADSKKEKHRISPCGEDLLGDIYLYSIIAHPLLPGEATVFAFPIPDSVIGKGKNKDLEYLESGSGFVIDGMPT